MKTGEVVPASREAPARGEAARKADPQGLSRALARFVAARPGFVDLGLPPAERYSPEELLPVARGRAAVTISLG